MIINLAEYTTPKKEAIIDALGTIIHRVEKGEILSLACVFKGAGQIGFSIYNCDGITLAGMGMMMNEIAMSEFRGK